MNDDHSPDAQTNSESNIDRRTILQRIGAAGVVGSVGVGTATAQADSCPSCPEGTERVKYNFTGSEPNCGFTLENGDDPLVTITSFETKTDQPCDPISFTYQVNGSYEIETICVFGGGERTGPVEQTGDARTSGEFTFSEDAPGEPAISNVTFCVTPTEPDPDPDPVVVRAECPDDVAPGRLVITNPNAAQPVSVQISGPSGFETTISNLGAGETTTVDGLANGSYTVTTSRTDIGLLVIGEETVVVDCPDGPPVEPNPVTVTASCPNGVAPGRLVLTNPNETETVSVTIDGPGGFTRTVDALGPGESTTIDDLENGSYTVTTSAGGDAVGEETVVVDCPDEPGPGPEPEPDDDGVVDIDIGDQETGDAQAGTEVNVTQSNTNTEQGSAVSESNGAAARSEGGSRSGSSADSGKKSSRD